MAIVYLGVGSNMGDRLLNIQQAITALINKGVVVTAQSTLIETDPVGGPPQGLFLNGALKAETDLEPLALLTVLKKIEQDMGRVKTVQDGPRPIDIDILLYEGVEMNTSPLTIPHPRMRQRDFVMTPLREIFPDVDRIKEAK